MADSSEDKSLELLRLQSEYARVHGAKLEMLYVIAQRQSEIKRLKDNVAKQDEHLTGLQTKIKSLDNGELNV